MDKVLLWIGGIFLGIGIFTVVILLVTLPLMWSWNYMMNPQITQYLFGVARLDFWHSLILAILCGGLFKSFSYKS